MPIRTHPPRSTWALGALWFGLHASGDKADTRSTADGDDTGVLAGENDGGSGDSGDSEGDCLPGLGLSGAEGPEAAVSPLMHKLGTLAIGCEDSVQIVVENRGLADLTVSSVVISNAPGDSAPGGELVDGGLVLAGGEAWCFDLAYAPSDTHLISSSVRVHSDDPLWSEVVALVSGVVVEVVYGRSGC